MIASEQEEILRILDFVGQQQADGGNHQAHPEGAGKDVQVDGLVRGGGRQLAEIVDPVVERRQQEIRGKATVVTTDHLPVGRVAPALGRGVCGLSTAFG